jgi:hypothetical protein
MAEDLEPQAPPYQSRFQLILGVLLGIGMAAIAATALFLADGKKADDQPTISWAQWRPTATDGLDAVKQIARHVGERYTLPSGNQLVAVRGGALELADLPVTVALQNQGDIEIVEDDQGVLYTFCGLGKDCAIKEGKPSVARHLVLRREALELALYTFRYVKDVDQVVVILPPPPGEKATQAMFYRRAEVGASLSRPLSVTLPGRPPAVNKLSAAQAEFITRLTAENLFAFTPREGPDAHIYLVLSPVPVK